MFCRRFQREIYSQSLCCLLSREFNIQQVLPAGNARFSCYFPTVSITHIQDLLWSVSSTHAVLWSLTSTHAVLWSVTSTHAVLWSVTSTHAVLWSVTSTHAVLWSVSSTHAVLWSVTSTHAVLWSVSSTHAVLWSVSSANAALLVAKGTSHPASLVSKQGSLCGPFIANKVTFSISCPPAVGVSRLESGLQ